MKRMLFIWTLLLSVFTLQAKTLIVYYSYTNNVHQIVTDLRTQIQADVLRIEPAEEGLDYAANNYAIGSALTDQACLALMELAAFHFAPLFESLGSAAKKCRRQARLPTLD